MNEQLLNQVMQMLGGPQQFQTLMNQAQQRLQQANMTPEQYINSMISSGQMTQEQFQQARNFANQVTGMNR